MRTFDCVNKSPNKFCHRRELCDGPSICAEQQSEVDAGLHTLLFGLVEHIHPLWQLRDQYLAILLIELVIEVDGSLLFGLHCFLEQNRITIQHQFLPTNFRCVDHFVDSHVFEAVHLRNTIQRPLQLVEVPF